MKQAVKKDNVIYFPVKVQDTVPVFIHTHERGEFIHYSVEGDSLKEFGVFKGDNVIARRISKKKEVFNGALCVLENGESVEVMKMKYNRDSSVTFYHSTKNVTGKLSDFAVTGIVEAFQRIL